MKTEELKAQGLTDEQVNYVMAEYGKDMTASKTKIATLEDELKVQKGVVEEKNTKIKELEGVDIEALKKAEYEKGKAEGTAEMETFKFNNALDNALREAKVKDSKAISGLLKMDEIKFEDGKITGLDEQIKTLKESHDYLFHSDKKNPKFTDATKGAGGEEITKEVFAKMGYKERLALKQTDPTKYEELKKQ